MHLPGLAIGRSTAFVGGALLVLMMLQIGVDVVLRALGGHPLPGTVEIVSNYYMVGVSFLPVAFAELHRRHIEATVFTDLLPRRGQHMLQVLAALLSFAVYALLAWQTGREAWKQTARGAFVESGQDIIPVWQAYWILPIAFLLMLAVLALRLAKRDFFSTLGDRAVDEGLDPDLQERDIAGWSR